jgi:hypothetical protein
MTSVLSSVLAFVAVFALVTFFFRTNKIINRKNEKAIVPRSLSSAGALESYISPAETRNVWVDIDKISKRKGGSQLICDSKYGLNYSLSSNIHVIVEDVRRYGLAPSCPCAFDGSGSCRGTSDMCVASGTSYFCQFKMDNITVTKWGALLHRSTGQLISFSHPTIAGCPTRRCSRGRTDDFTKGHTDAFKKHSNSSEQPLRRDLVVPVRMRWDDCFNHLSFQSLPLIGAVFELMPDMWHRVHWHASRFSAAMLQLMGVPLHKIVIEQPVHAETVVLPWIPHWDPVWISSLHGIARNVCKRMTQSLLELKIPADQMAAIEPLNIFNYELKSIDEASLPKNGRFVVYMHRSFNGTRLVVNVMELLSVLSRALRPEYTIVVLASTVEYQTIPQLHMVWQHYARIISRARVVVGPHGRDHSARIDLSMMCVVNCVLYLRRGYGQYHVGP